MGLEIQRTYQLDYLAKQHRVVCDVGRLIMDCFVVDTNPKSLPDLTDIIQGRIEEHSLQVDSEVLVYGRGVSNIVKNIVWDYLASGILDADTRWFLHPGENFADALEKMNNPEEYITRLS